MSRPIFFQVLVLDNNDPLMLGRIRGTLITDNYADIIKSFDDPPWNEAKNAWTERDPFIFNPLLPYFIYQVPKINELVQIMYVNRDFKYQNQYYVQNTFYSPTSSYLTYQEGANKFTGTGMQIENPTPLKNTVGSVSGVSYTEKGIHKGVFPEIPDRRTNRPKPIGNQSREVALRPGTAVKTSNPRFRKIFLYVCVSLGPEL